MEVLTFTANIVAAIASVVIAIRLLTFRRGSARYRRPVSLIAWLLININLIGAVWLFSGGISNPLLAVANAALVVNFARLICWHRGNVAEILPGRLINGKN